MTIDEQAAQLLASGNVRIHWRTDTMTSAKVRDNGIFDVRWQRLTGWNCTCQADVCAHVASVRMITNELMVVSN
jgi:hypothetical protein